MTTVAVLGTGIMGSAMSRRMRESGLGVRVWNRTSERAERLEDDGVEASRSPAEAVAGATVVITALHDADSVMGVMEPLAPRLDDNTVWLQMATIGVRGIDRVHELAQRHGLSVLDAPVVGTKAPAESGTLVVLVSGNPVLEEEVRPVLEAIGSRVVWVGDRLGPATRLKLVVNAWVASLCAAAGQSVAMAQGLGLDPQAFLDVIGGGPTDSSYAQLKGGLMIRREYEPAFTVDNVSKDVGLMREAADDAGIDTSLLEALRWVYAHASELGHGADDMAAVWEAFPERD